MKPNETERALLELVGDDRSAAAAHVTVAVDRAIDHEGCHDCVMAQAGYQRAGFPMSMGNATHQPFTAQATAPQPHHVGAGSGFVDEYQPGRVEQRPASACAAHIRPLVSRAAVQDKSGPIGQSQTEPAGHHRESENLTRNARIFRVLNGEVARKCRKYHLHFQCRQIAARAEAWSSAKVQKRLVLCPVRLLSRGPIHRSGLKSFAS